MKSRSVWQQVAEDAHQYPPLQGDIEVDVAIVGAGITGITSAALLTQAGKRVAVVDRRGIASGITAFTTAHLFSFVDTYLQDIAKHFGDEGARLIGQAHLNAISQIEALARQYEVDCEYKRLRGYLFTEKSEEINKVREEGEWMTRAGMATQFFEMPDIPVSTVSLPIPAKAAVVVENQGRFHPTKYVVGMAEKLAAQGCQFFGNTIVEKYEDGDKATITTEKGTITADAVILATHIPFGLHVADFEVFAYNSYVIAFRMPEALIEDALYWDTEDPYHYLRLEQDETGWLLIVGGEDHKTGQEEDTEARYTALEQYARQRFNVGEVVYRWSSEWYEPADGVAYIGRNPGGKNVYIATGYSGNGMTYGVIAANVITNLILAREYPYTDLFNPSRLKPIASFPDLITENIKAVSHLVGDRFRSEGNTLTEIAPGTGKIVRPYGEQLAAYRDEAGQLHLLSPVCPHLKCIVDWNAAEKTWDCPCHGGRFTAEGEWLSGPSIHALKKLTQAEAEGDTQPDDV